MSYTVSEDDGAVTFEIVKIGDSDIPVSVEFSTMDGTATGTYKAREFFFFSHQPWNGSEVGLGEPEQVSWPLLLTLNAWMHT